MQMQGCTGGRGMWVKKFWNCVEEWKRREKAFEAGPNIFAQVLLTRLFTALVGLASLARMSHFEMSAGLCSPKPTPEKPPHSGRIRNHSCMMLVSLWSQSQICPMKGLAIGVLRGVASNRELRIQAGRAPAAARKSCNATRQQHSNRCEGSSQSLSIELIATGLGSAGLIPAGGCAM
jgi:hypothetical protein